jgi:hypothetical protein
MRNSYTIPEPYANEKSRIDAYKKILYKEKPTAVLILKGVINWRYAADTSIGVIFFEVSKKEMGELEFGKTEQAQLLIRWIKI